MAFQKDIALEIGISVAGAYNKITRVEVVAEGTEARMSCVVCAYKSKADADANVVPLQRKGYDLGIFDKADPRPAAAIAYEKLGGLDDYLGATPV